MVTLSVRIWNLVTELRYYHFKLTLFISIVEIEKKGKQLMINKTR